MKRCKKMITCLLILFLMTAGNIDQALASQDSNDFLPGGAWEEDLGIEMKLPELEGVVPYSKGYGQDNENDSGKDSFSEQISAERISEETFYDPRDNGMVSQIRDQGKTALCWDYAALSTVESSLIKNGLSDSGIDLSELHSAYFSYRDRMEQGKEEKDLSFWQFCLSGGSPVYVLDLLVKRQGPVYGGIDEVIKEETVSQNDVSKIEELSQHENMAELAAIYCIDAEDRECVKDAIRQFGAVCGVYYSYGAYYRDHVNEKGDASYHMPYPVKTVNHAISIVGWDDNFPAECFEKEFYRMESEDGTQRDYVLPNGAWLVKNSWGEKCYKSGEKASGYYWISFYDRSLQSLMALQMRSVDEVPKSITLSDKEISVQKGECYGKSLTADIEPKQAVSRECIWSSLDETVATVTQDGLVYGKNVGRCMIRARTKEGFVYDECLVTVTEKLPAKDSGDKRKTINGNVESYIDTSIKSNDQEYAKKIISSNDQSNCGLRQTGIQNDNGIRNSKRKAKASKSSVTGQRKRKKQQTIFYKKGVLLYEITNGKAVVKKAVKQKAMVRIPDRIKRKGKLYPIVRIKNGAFKNNVKLKTVRIGKNVRIIGSHAFDGCVRLKRLIFISNLWST